MEKQISNKKMFSKFYISSICDDSIFLSKKYGFGIEPTEYSYSENLDVYFDMTHKKVMQYKNCTDNLIFHAPFYEMSMAAIDSKAKQLSFDRFNQFYEVAMQYNPKKYVYHSGYNPNVYYVEWFQVQSIEFLKEFMKNKQNTICLENVFSKVPDLIYDIVTNVANENLKICLDIGHVNAYADKINGLSGNDLIYYWIDKLAPLISHFHIHNNYGTVDIHGDFYDGNLDITKILEYAMKKCKNATYTIEVSNIKDFDKEIEKIIGNM